MSPPAPSKAEQREWWNRWVAEKLLTYIPEPRDVERHYRAGWIARWDPRERALVVYSEPVTWPPAAWDGPGAASDGGGGG
jgi:hypothetical protein